MSYFRELPNLSYVSRFSGANRNDERVEVKNLFKRARLRSDIDAAITAFNYYKISEGERPDTLAKKIYGDPELDFQNESYLTIRDGKNHRTKYFFADPSCIVLPPEKSLTLPSTDASFTLDTNNLTQLLKAAAIYQLHDLSAVGDNGVVQLVVRDKKNDTSNDFSIVVGETDKKFTFNFKVENIKILPGTYQVAISEKLLSRFVNENYNLTYYIALEPDSTFG